jgi:ketosteroid isomerase-like protein
MQFFQEKRQSKDRPLQGVYMSVQLQTGFRVSKLRHHRWVLYVVLAFVGGLLTFVGAMAQQKASDDARFRKLTDAYCTAWSSGSPANAAKFYAKNDGLVFYDVAQFSYHGWKEYETDAQKGFFDLGASLTLSAGKELKATRRGNVAWTTVPMHLSEKTKDGKDIQMNFRYTGIWEKRGKVWLLVHEHISVPLT